MLELTAIRAIDNHCHSLLRDQGPYELVRWRGSSSSIPAHRRGGRQDRCPGYVKDHVKALACGGPDSVANMQWQTVVAGKAKDKWERRGCR